MNLVDCENVEVCMQACQLYLSFENNLIMKIAQNIITNYLAAVPKRNPSQIV